MAKRYVRAKHVKTKTARSIAAYTVDDYMNYLTDTKKIIKNNLIAGLARGLGMAVGFSILGRRSYLSAYCSGGQRTSPL